MPGPNFYSSFLKDATVLKFHKLMLTLGLMLGKVNKTELIIYRWVLFVYIFAMNLFRDKTLFIAGTSKKKQVSVSVFNLKSPQTIVAVVVIKWEKKLDITR